MKIAQPRQTHEEHDGRDRGTRFSAESGERTRKRIPNPIDASRRLERADKRAFERRAREQHAEKPEPKANRAGAAQAVATGEHRFDESPQEREKPDD
ncbi:hypothetical protein [Caballeronia terrestris]|uniref:hypothetical protein n=1 Tax=Caballeronia terrestris TaxID=1226301 RepID=UPI001F1B7776|nr:hypothetical protein [Caballeronia terrestris]